MNIKTHGQLRKPTNGKPKPPKRSDLDGPADQVTLSSSLPLSEKAKAGGVALIAGAAFGATSVIPFAGTIFSTLGGAVAVQGLRQNPKGSSLELAAGVAMTVAGHAAMLSGNATATLAAAAINGTIMGCGFYQTMTSDKMRI